MSSTISSNAVTSTTNGTSIGSSSTVANSGTTASAMLSQLANNFQDFLGLLTTQLQNQDPTSPMDTNQFTSELVQFTSVQEQVNTNATLNQVLTSSQGQLLSQATGMVGKTAQFTSTSMPLQNGTAQIDFTTPSAEQVQIAITDASGNAVTTQTVNATSGANVWNWDGTNSAGKQMPDGTYTAAVTTVPTSGSTTGTAVPFTVVGTITGAEQTNGSVQLMFGSDTTTFDKVVNLGTLTGS